MLPIAVAVSDYPEYIVITVAVLRTNSTSTGEFYTLITVGWLTTYSLLMTLTMASLLTSAFIQDILNPYTSSQNPIFLL